MSNDTKHKKKKVKLKLRNLISFLMILGLMSLIALVVYTFKIQNIYISGNKLYTDYEILTLSKLKNKPSFLATSAFLTEIELEKQSLIKNAVVKKKFFGVFKIKIEEYQIYFKTDKNVIMIENGTAVTDFNKDIPVPLLVSHLTKGMFDKLVIAFGDIDSDVISKISEIEYKPSVLDKERFLFLMADGNYSYVTLGNIENINYYSKIVTQLEGKKGVINFDSYRANDAGITIDIIN